MADEYKINTRDVDDTSAIPNGAYYIPTDNIGSSSSGSSLPDVTSDDNGDVLAVVEGVWAKSNPPSGLPAVTIDDNGDVLSVVNGAWAKTVPLPVAYFIPGDYGDEDVISHDYDDVFQKVYDEGGIVLFKVEFNTGGAGNETDIIAQAGPTTPISLTGKTAVTLTEGEDGYTVSVTPVVE